VFMRSSPKILYLTFNHRKLSSSLSRSPLN